MVSIKQQQVEKQSKGLVEDESRGILYILVIIDYCVYQPSPLVPPASLMN